MGKKIIDFVKRRIALRGRKSKAGWGEIIKGYGIIYTPVILPSRAGQRIVQMYAETAIALFLPELEKGLFDENWRIRWVKSCDMTMS